MNDRIADMIDYAWRFVGTPYIWGGDDPSGFDCSGFVIECLKAVGLMREHEDTTAEGLRIRFLAKQTTTPTEGCLAFRLNDAGKAEHVVLCIGNGLYIGADGGRSIDTGAPQAWIDNAFVKMRPLSRFDQTKLIFVDPFKEI